MRTGLFRAISIAPLVLCAGLSAQPAFAAGNYTQNFTSAPSDWIHVNDTYALGTGAYAGAYVSQAPDPNQPFRALAIYNGTTWGTNFTYSARLNSDYEQDGNRVGVVFNYTDTSNYYELSVSMRKTATSDPTSGKATLVRRVAGQPNPTPISDYHPADTAPWPTRDTFFTVTVARVGTHTVIRVDNTVVYEGNDLTNTSLGRIGFFSQHNNGRFDDVSVTDTTPTTFLFRSGFNSPVVTTTPSCIGGTWFVNLSGADASGMAWQPTFWGAPAAPAFNTNAPCTSSSPATDMNAYVEIGLTGANPGPTGPASQVLRNKVKQWHTNSNLSIEPRAGVNHVLPSAGTPAESYYIRRYLKYGDPGDDDIDDLMGVNSWFTQHEYKSFCGTSGATYPGRLVIDWQKPAGVPTYVIRRDNNNNCTPAAGEVWTNKTCLASGEPDECPEMPVGEWFYDELYVSYPATGTGVVKYAINGDMIFNYTPTAGEHLPTKPKQVKLTPGYLNSTNVEVQVDDLEVLEHIPCAEFPCGPPTHVAD